MISIIFKILLQHHVDPAIGVYIIDRFTYYALEFLERVTPYSEKTLAQFVSILFKQPDREWLFFLLIYRIIILDDEKKTNKDLIKEYMVIYIFGIDF